MDDGDAGDYQCMIGAIVDSKLEKNERSVSVSVARQAELQFGDELGDGDSWMLVKDQVKKYKISFSNSHDSSTYSTLI